ncbi:MAG: cation-transporting P-type ATPase [Parachlamydiales bacterium]|jgi:Ca2+-transporting ATPase
MFKNLKTHAINLNEIFNLYKTSADGLSQKEADNRLKIYGENTLKEKEESKFIIFFRQFNSILIYVLLAASLFSILTYKYVEFLVIIFIILVNSIIGFIQEVKALSSIKALKKLTKSKTKVLRDGQVVQISSDLIVPGDIVIFSEGDVVVADIRLIESSSLMLDESTLTGESMPVIKDHAAEIPENALPYELRNTLFSGTAVVKGRGLGVVTKTADYTYLASIAEEKEKSPKTPFTEAIASFSKKYIFLLVFLFSIIAFVGILQNRHLFDLVYILIAELVSAVPEGLPIVITTVLVVGAISLSKKKTLVRYLPSVETLGSATVIASDKTGTITEGKLEVKDFYAIDLKKLRLVAALCNEIDNDIGDPLDIALRNWVDDHNSLREKHVHINTFSFDIHLRAMATVYEVDSKKEILVKGAFESLKEIASNKQDFEILEKHLMTLSQEGLRTIALGYGEYNNEKEFKSWKIKIVGLVGFLDPPKKEVKEAVLEAKRAGIKVIMLTGDFPLTAKAIAKDVAIFKEGDELLTGDELEQMDDKTLYERLKNTSVLARILPEHKSRIVRVMQENDEIVAVSGDGVNDVPALRTADLGIAMGSGSEAAKSVSKMIIIDNNLKVIVGAIKNGRVIVGNIRKVIYYLLSSSLLEITLISGAIFANLPLPISAIQILWLNLVTGGMQDKTFPFAKEEENVMLNKPKKPKKEFFDLQQVSNILFFGLFSGLFMLLLFNHLRLYYDHSVTLTIIFTCVVLMQLANGIQAQKENEPFFKNIKRSFTINPYIFLGVGAGFLMQLFAIYIAEDLFLTEHISFQLWLYPLAMFFVAFFLVELRKCIYCFFRRFK